MVNNTFPSDTEWTETDQRLASSEGWNIWDCSGSGNGRTQLCRCDEMENFADDHAAWKHVWEKAREGSELHQKALRLIHKHNQNESSAISEWCAS